MTTTLKGLKKGEEKRKDEWKEKIIELPSPRTWEGVLV